MDNPQSKVHRMVNRFDYAKNISGFLGFTALFLYCAYLLSTTGKPDGLLVYAVVMLGLLVAIIRSGKRVIAIRRMLSNEQ
jgi:hypothetical protein